MRIDLKILEEDILRLYREPIVGANYNNTYGEENLVNLVNKYRSLTPEQMEFMRELVAGYSQSPRSCFQLRLRRRVACPGIQRAG